MELIQSVTVGSGGAASIDFTSIPATYTDLAIYVSIRSTRAANQDPLRMQFNSTTTNYSYRQLYGGAAGGSAVTGSDSGSVAFVGLSPAANNTANTFSSQWIYIPNYTASSNKSYSIDSVSENNASTYFQLDLIAQLWSNSAAINSIKLLSENAANFAQYSTAYLYGVTNVTTSAKATGGTITSDGAYFYHTFTSSGTFTPTQSLTADTLVVAGGGGGGYQANGGGGGAGGLLYGSLSLTATAYTVTIGAGGTTPYPGGGAGGDGSNSSFTGSYVSYGGGGGGGNGALNGRNGGSGGGGAGSSTSGGTATQTSQSPLTGYGNAGYGGAQGGGGGADGAGIIGSTGDGTNTGGPGKTYYGVTYARGGDVQYPNTTETANSGNGGNQGSAGASGIVIVRYAI